MNKKIKLINEQFAQTLNGDGFNSSNGVFKVNYKAYSDLSISVGRDSDPTLLVKDSSFQVGDIVKGNTKGVSKKVKGEVIDVSKSTDGKSYIIKIQSLKNKKKYTLIPGSIEFSQDRGNSKNGMGMSIDSREKNAQNLKYNGGNVVWGSLENKILDHPYADVEGGEVTGPMGTDWKINFVDNLDTDNLLFNSILVDPNKKLISFSRSARNVASKDILKAGESYCYFKYHPELSNESDDLKFILSVVFLEMKNEQDAKKEIIKHCPDIIGKSYGECRDENIDKANSIINSLL